jgi:NADH dehydrogenase
MKKKIVIVGGGYGGIRAMEKLSKEKDVEITLIDQHTYHYLQTEAYALIANEIKLTEVTVELRSLCEAHNNVQFLNDEVTSIDLHEQTLNVKHQEKPLSYDYIVIATGSRTFFPEKVPGLKEYAFGVKTLSCAFDLKQHFAKLLYELMQSHNDDTHVLNVVIGGAGLSGVEIAAEMAHYSNKYMKNNHMLGKGIKVHLIASRDSVLDGMHPYIQKSARKRLQNLGVNILFNTRIKEVKETEVLLNTGDTIDFNFMIFTGGVTSSPLASTLKCELTPKGKIITLDTLQIKGFGNAYAIGDASLIKNKYGDAVADTANAAEQTGDIVATNISASMHNKSHRTKFANLEGVLVALGGKNAAIILFDFIKVSGYLGYMLKSFITWQYKVQLDMKANKWYSKQD